MTGDSSSLSGLLSTPLVLPASVAGALTALFVVLMVIALRRGGTGALQRWLSPLLTFAVVAAATMAVLDRMADNDRAAERRALLQRYTDLSASALAPGSRLSCLDGVAGESVGNACEKAIFADAQTVASAVAFTAQRLALLKDAASLAEREPGLAEAFVSTKRALELDRFGLTAHVLAEQSGCTTERCAAFALVQDSATLKANMRVRAFDTYVARYAEAWSKPDSRPEPVAEPRPPAPAAPVVASAPTPPDTAARAPVSTKYDFPSAASIPAVSIMSAEPPLPKSAEAPAAAPTDAAPVPVPPRRPQAHAAPAPPR